MNSNFLSKMLTGGAQPTYAGGAQPTYGGEAELSADEQVSSNI